MNYAAVFIAFILGAAAVYWYVSGRKFYSGPIVEAQMGETDSQSDHVAAGDRKVDKEAMV